MRDLSAGLRSQFARNMGAGSLMAILGSVLSILSYPLYLHYLGYHRYGLWLVLSVVISVAQLGNLGIPWALMNLVAEERAKADWKAVRAYINAACGVIVGCGVVAVAIVAAMRQSIAGWLGVVGADGALVVTMLPWVACVSMLALLFSTFNAALGGLGRMDLVSYNETLAQMLGIVFSGILLYFRFDLWAMALGSVLAYAVAQVIAFVQIRSRIPIPLLAVSRLSPQKMRRLFGTGGWILGSGAFAVLMIPFTRMMLSRMAGMEAVAINDMCLVGSMRVRNVFDSAFRPAMPELSSISSEEKGLIVERIRRINRSLWKIVVVAALPAFAILIVAINPLLHLWLHSSYNILLPGTFRVALIGAFVSLMGSSVYYIMIGLGRPQDAAFSTAIQFFVNAAVLLGMAFAGGRITVMQAAVAFVLANAASTLYLRVRLYRLVKESERRSGQPELVSCSPDA